MNDGPPAGDPAPDDLGEPITALATLDLEPSTGFWPTVRKKIDRRLITSHVAVFSWQLPGIILLEFLNMAFGLFGGRERPKGGVPLERSCSNPSTGW